MASTSRVLRSQRQQTPIENGKVLEGAALGVDVGTTATRASLAPLRLQGKINEQPWIVPRPRLAQHRERFNFGDFPSAANFFAVNKPPASCIGFIGDDPNHIPVKMYTYIVRIIKLRKRSKGDDLQNVETHLEKIPQLNSFFDRFDKLDEHMQRRVLAHAQCIFLAHLRQVRSKSEEMAESRNVKITKLAATIPPNWDRWTQHFYILLLIRVWDNLESDAIILLHESEAIGHWLLCLDQKTRTLRPKQLVLADFGGHTLNYNVFEINYRDDNTDAFAFFTLSVDNCIHGGSELHASYVKDRVRKDIASQTIRVEKKYEPYVYETLMNDYRLKRSTINGDTFWISGQSSPKPNAKSVSVVFSKQEAKSLYEKCFAKPLAELYGVLRRSAKVSKNTVVVLNGGTFSNTHIEGKTLQEIAKAGLKNLPWTDSVTVECQMSSTVAVGAALAMVNTMSVEQFMNRAAFAVLVKPTQDHNMPVIWNSNGSQTAKISLQGRQGADIFITCCPLAPRDGAMAVPIESTFEFQSLSKNLKGDYTISLNYEKENVSKGVPDQLILTITEVDLDKSADANREEPADTNREEPADANREEPTDANREEPADSNHEEPADAVTTVWPVYYDPGGCVCFLDVDEIDQMQKNSKSVPDPAPTRFRNKKGANSYFQWEEGRIDPSRPFWEGSRAPGLLPPTKLEELEMDAPVEDQLLSVIEISDSDSNRAHNSPRQTRGGRGRASKARRQENKTPTIPLRRNKKRRARATVRQDKGKHGEIPAAEAGIVTRQMSAQGVPELTPDPGAADCSFAPEDAYMEDYDTSRSHTISSRARNSQEFDTAANSSHAAQDNPDVSLATSWEPMQPAKSNDNDSHLTRDVTGRQTSANAKLNQPASLIPSPTRGFEDRSHHGMDTRTYNDSPHDTSSFEVDGLPREELQPRTAAEIEAVAAAIHSSQESGQDWREHVPAQMDINQIRLPISTRPNAGPWAERVLRDMRAPFAGMSTNEQ